MHTGRVAVNPIQRWAEGRLLDTMTRSAAAGHDCNSLVRRPSGPGQQRGVICVCSCGWESSPRKPMGAALAGLWHATEVCAVLDERKRLDLVEWSAAPDSKTLRHLLRQPQDGVSRRTSHPEAS